MSDQVPPLPDEVVLRNRAARVGAAIFLGILGGVIVCGPVSWLVRGELSVPWFLLFLTPVYALAGVRFLGQGLPTRLSPLGIHVRGSRPLSPWVLVRWGDVERVWLGTTGFERSLLVRVRDPESFAGANAGLRRRMRATRRATAADFAVPLPGARPDEIRAAVGRFGGGTLRLRWDLDPSSTAGDEVVLRNRHAGWPATAAVVAGALALVVTIEANEEWPPGPWIVPGLLISALLLTAARLLIIRLGTPPRVSRDGLRLRRGLRGYDTEIPWSRVASARVERRRLLITLRTPDEGGGLVLPLTGVRASDAQVAAAVARLRAAGQPAAYAGPGQPGQPAA